jgi:hypothetical protein
MYAILNELPDGYSSKWYEVTVGETYEVKYVSGSCYVIIDDEGEEATIAQSRFTLKD